MRSAEPALPFRHAVAMGLLQGPTELLPISSSGHIALLPWLAGWPYAQLPGERRKSFEVALHAGASAALAIRMRRRLADELTGLDRRGIAVLSLSLAPPAVVGLTLHSAIERHLGGPRSTAAGLVAGALAMAFADGVCDGDRACADAGPRDGIALGVAQASALMPGVSRGGATLAAARMRGFARPAAFALSWRTALPVMLAAGVLEGVRLRARGVRAEERAALAVGAAGAFASTLASATVIGRRDGEARLLPYALYRGALAAVVVARVRRAG
jgi:undecaprenyl-diphosphatase